MAIVATLPSIVRTSVYYKKAAYDFTVKRAFEACITDYLEIECILKCSIALKKLL